MTSIRLGIAVAVLMTALVAAGPAAALENFQFKDSKTFSLGSDPEFDVSTISGDVRYEGADVSDVTVSILVDVEAKDEDEARDIQGEIDIRVEGQGGYLEATVDQPDNFNRILRRRYGKDRSISVSFLLTGPKGARGSLSTVSGDAEARHLAGPADLSTVSGDVRVTDVEENVDATSVSGEVTVNDCRADVDASTVSGDVTVSGCGGDLDVSSVSGQVDARDITGRVESSNVSGDILLRAVGRDASANSTSGEIRVEHLAGNLDLETVSGDIEARSESVDGLLEVHSNSGTVRVYAKSDQVGRVRLSTFSGEIQVDSDLGHDYSLGAMRGRGRLTLDVDRGGLNLDIDTHSGDILIGER